MSRTLAYTFCTIYYAAIIVKVNSMKSEPLNALLHKPRVNKINK